jgi:excisionase family DNA binding protein
MASDLTSSSDSPDDIRAPVQLIEQGGAKLVAPDGVPTAIPQPISELFLLLLNSVRGDQAMTAVRQQRQLTTGRAGKLLGVSIPFLRKLLKKGEIRFHMVGSHYRLEIRRCIGLYAPSGDHLAAARCDGARR